MFDLDGILDTYMDDFKNIFFFEEWLDLDLKFSKTELFTLLFLYKMKELTMTELVDYINVPMSTATGIGDRLVKKGYILRDRSDEDRRIVILKLTKEGIDFVENIKSLILKYIDLVLKDLTDEEKQFLLKVAIKIINSLKQGFDSDNTERESRSQLKKIDIE